ncbi:aromatic ring-hydroxylating dioxygenase subunit alpha [Nostoc sp. FACHB-892]|uniref:aromatic ring-hydroxylating oxygenase subunit alpha n=1 Tax=Nostoc sp. FACHB-892 TaxID=2692843 RepID=UPI001687F72A|nr:aromatic ring-hydroxylating dioxygenase subunit alpha [Nostoc sp. FACHB-892]MBD2729714.1 aromatic ring-hydroxylating dioxygenase subunit alpha [Nostoc sp. FACHB-892]
MMKPLIPPSYYQDTEIFQREQVLIFQNLWNFAGFTIDLQSHNDYICAEIGGKSIIVQNFHGELRAFLNVCSHRFSQIHQLPQGNGALKCPYHSWTFNCDGIPIGIPLVERFDTITDAKRESLRLEKWLVETCGKLVFVKRNDDGIILKEFLGSIYEKLAEFSEAFGQKINEWQVKVNANWKITTENTLEGYHVFPVHKNTFGKYGIPVDIKYICNELHTGYSDKGNPEYFEKFKKKIDRPANFLKKIFLKKAESIFGKRPLKLGSYYHQLVFPNLTISTNDGVGFSVQVHQPINSEETKLVHHLFACKLELKSKIEQGIFDRVAQQFTKMYVAVYEEDKAICETVQRGISSQNKEGGIFSLEEQRIYEFHKAYAIIMNFNPT